MFCHIESRGKYDATNLIKLKSNLFSKYSYQLDSFQKLLKILQTGALVTIAFFLTHPVYTVYGK